MTLAEFSEAEFQKALKRNIRALTRGKTVSLHPQAVLLCGQNGAGDNAIMMIVQ